MSAYIVSNTHLNYLVQAGLCYGRQFPVSWQCPDTEEPPGSEDYEAGNPWGPTATETAQRKRRTLTSATANAVLLMLAAANYASVNFRYDEKEPMDAISRFRPPRKPLTAVQVLKAISCYEYQSCEPPDWKQSEAHAFCKALEAATIQHLPGYEEAEWGID